MAIWIQVPVVIVIPKHKSSKVEEWSGLIAQNRTEVGDNPTSMFQIRILLGCQKIKASCSPLTTCWLISIFCKRVHTLSIPLMSVYFYRALMNILDDHWWIDLMTTDISICNGS